MVFSIVAKLFFPNSKNIFSELEQQKFPARTAHSSIGWSVPGPKLGRDDLNIACPMFNLIVYCPAS